MEGPHPGEASSFKRESGTDTEGMDLVVYVFSNNNTLNTQNSGAPELMELRTSFEPEPQWLDDPTWYHGEGLSGDKATTSEVQDSLRLHSFQR